MFDPEQDLLHRDVALPDDPGRIEQDQASHEPQDQMAVVGILSLPLAGLGRQEMFQGTERLLNPAAPPPRPDHAWGADGRLPTEQVVAVSPWLLDDDDGDPAIRGAAQGEPDIVDPRL